MENDILEKASQLFIKLGFKSVTMDDIATEMAISKKTIYQYFSSKPDLIEATLDYIIDKVDKELRYIMSLNLDPVTEIIKAQSHIDEVFKISTSAPMYQLKKYYPKIATKMKIRQIQNFEEISNMNILKGIENGIYRPNIDVTFSSRYYFMGCLGLDDLDIFPSDQFPYEKTQRMLLEYHLRSIATPKGLKILESLIENQTSNE